MNYSDINKLADLQDFNRIAVVAIIRNLLKVKHVIDRTGLAYSSNMQNHWLRLWEYAGAIIGSQLDRRMTVLDAGGTGTIFSYYMALEGCNVHTVDTWDGKVADAVELSQELGLEMHHSAQDIMCLDYADCYFDAIYCICVIEHLEKDWQPIAIRELSRLLNHGGIMALTFDYGKDGAAFPILDSSEVVTRLAEPSGLEILGNQKFHATSNDLCGTCPDYTFGALFLKKPGDLSLPNKGEIPMGTPEAIDICERGPILSMKYLVTRGGR